MDLSPSISPGDTQRVKVLFELRGTLKLKTETSQPVRTPVDVTAQCVYSEKTLAVAPKHRGNASTVRYYKTAKATIKFREGAMHPELREERRLIGVRAATAREVVVYSPLGPLSRDELDLIDVPANSAIIDGLLPNRTVAVHESWKTGPAILVPILGLDAISQHNVRCTLDRIEKNRAVVHIKGTVSGAIEGVSTEISLAAKYSFDLDRRRINWFAMSLKENRSIGHAHPGLEVDVRVQMACTRIAADPALHDSVVADLNLTADDPSRLLEFTSKSGGFALLTSRKWHAMIEREDVSVLRLVDRGDLVAQCNISALDPVETGESFTMVDFQQDIKRALDDTIGQFITASESLTDSRLHVMRVVVAGQVSEIDIEWVYYHISNEDGRRATCVFTCESDLSDRLAAADQSLISSFRFIDRAATQPDLGPKKSSE